MSSIARIFRNIDRCCRRCGKSLILRNSRDIKRKHFCSRKCLGKYRGDAKRLEISEGRECQKCGTQFTAVRDRHWFCSRYCREQVTYRRAIEKKNSIDGFLARLIRPEHRPKLDAAYLRMLYDEQSGRCALTGFEMTHLAGHGRQPLNVSIDRIDSARGYTRDNVQLVCWRANSLKSDASLNDLYAWCSAIVRTHAVRLEKSG